MSWAGTAQSGLFWTINTGGGIQRVDWEPPRGDVSGLIDNLIVIGLRGETISADIPVSGDLLQFDGTQWSPVGTAVLVPTHNLLSSTHPDTVPASPIDGDIIAGSGDPASWARFPIGDPGYNLTVDASGSLTWSPGPTSIPKIITVGGYEVLEDIARTVIVNKTVGGPITVIPPPAPILGQQLIIKDGKGDANTNNITITSSGTTIDGNSSILITHSYQSFTILYNGTEWNIV